MNFNIMRQVFNLAQDFLSMRPVTRAQVTHTWCWPWSHHLPHHFLTLLHQHPRVEERLSNYTFSTIYHAFSFHVSAMPFIIFFWKDFLSWICSEKCPSSFYGLKSFLLTSENFSEKFKILITVFWITPSNLVCTHVCTYYITAEFTYMFFSKPRLAPIETIYTLTIF